MVKSSGGKEFEVAKSPNVGMERLERLLDDISTIISRTREVIVIASTRRRECGDRQAPTSEEQRP